MWLPSVLQTLRAKTPAGKERDRFLARVLDPDPLGEIGLLLHSEAREEYVWHPGDALGHHLVLLCPILIVSGQIQKLGLRRAW